jgi:glycosyltransferase involved in cell wall biosynthesis
MRILTDEFWFNGKSGISRHASEVSNYLKKNHVLEFTGRSGINSLALRPLKLAMECRQSKSDIFWSPGFAPPVGSRIPVIVTIHDLNHLHCYSWFHAIYARQIFARLWRRCAAIITVSETVKSDIVSLLGESFRGRIHVAYNGISNEFRKNRPPARDGRYLLYVGNRRGYKNLRRMFQAAAPILLEKELRFAVTGTIDKDIHRAAKGLGLEKRLVSLGTPTEQELCKWYSEATATLFLSLYEGFGLPPLESLACRTPVIVSNVSAMPEICGKLVRYVDPYNIDDIRAGINEVIQSRSDWIQRIEEESAWLDRYSWDQTAQVVQSIMETVFHNQSIP